MKLLRWEYKQTKRAERRATYERLALKAQANIDEEKLYPDEPGDDELWGSYTGPAQVPSCCAILAGIARAGRTEY